MMEEEIDIEEHDVLDNPRIKHIFPDLTIVKVEALDEEVVEEQINEDYIDLNGYLQYENDCDYNEYDYYNNVEEDIDIENYTNKIILGSKPNTKGIEEQSIKKEYLPAMVMLEDWGERLNNSSCFCKDCKILFATNNALDYHKMVAHSFLVAITNKAVKSTARNSTAHIKDVDKVEDGALTPKKVEDKINVEKNKLCNHCNKYFPDGNTLIKHLYELLTKNDKNNEVKKSLRTSNSNYQCRICQKLFLSHSGGKVHLTTVHPEVYTDDDIIKVNVGSVEKNSDVKLATTNTTKVKTYLTSNTEINYWYNTRTFIKNPPVPNSVLYKCFKCSIHFVMASPAVHHKRYCSKNTKFLRCYICKRKMRCNDILLHKLQHKVSSEFKIYNSGSRNYRRTLCKCPKCSVCHTEMKFWPHYKVCNGIKTDCNWCEMCAEFIHLHVIVMHKNLHKIGNSDKTDFIIITYTTNIHSKGIEETERKAMVKKRRMNESTEVLPVRKMKKLNNNSNKKGRKFPLYYCKLCNCCVHKISWDRHLGSNCRKAIKIICDKCGLTFTQKSIKKHKIQHENSNLTLYDFEFLSRDGSRIIPKAPDFHKCWKCKVHFLSKQHRKSHKCFSKHETCQICTKKYNSHAFKLHMQFHLYDKNDKQDQLDTIDTPDTTKTYYSLNKMWNILFLCEACGVNTDSYDEAVSHSQSHLIGSTDIGRHALCKVCDLKFGTECYKSHVQLHKQLPINKKDFLILPYRYRALFKNQWFNLFGKLAPRQIQQIILQSIYRDTRRVSMKMVTNGRPEYTLYICKSCKLCVKGQDIKKHIRSCCSEVHKNLHCQDCDVFFDVKKNYKRHVKLHEKIQSDFRVVMFEAMAPLINHLNLKNDGLKLNGEHFLFNKCAYCEVSVLARGPYVKKHVCNNGVLTKCGLCGIAIRVNSKASHMRLHRKYPTLSKKTIKYEMFQPKNRKPVFSSTNESEYVTPGKIDCDKRAETFHKDMNQTEKEDNGKFLTSKLYLVTCKTCRLVFKSRRELAAHHPNCNGMINGTHERADETLVECNAMLYKCSKCSSHFLQRKSLIMHTNTCQSVKRTLHKCNICGLDFTLISLNKHKMREHSEEKYLFKVTELDSRETRVYSG